MTHAIFCLYLKERLLIGKRVFIPPYNLIAISLLPNAMMKLCDCPTLLPPMAAKVWLAMVDQHLCPFVREKSRSGLVKFI